METLIYLAAIFAAMVAVAWLLDENEESSWLEIKKML